MAQVSQAHDGEKDAQSGIKIEFSDDGKEWVDLGKCRWDISEHDEQWYVCWILSPAVHCPDCLSNASKKI